MRKENASVWRSTTWSVGGLVMLSMVPYLLLIRYSRVQTNTWVDTVAAGMLCLLAAVLTNSSIFRFAAGGTHRFSIKNLFSWRYEYMTTREKEIILSCVPFASIIGGCAAGFLGWFILPYVGLTITLWVIGSLLGLYSLSVMLPSTRGVFTPSFSASLLIYAGCCYVLGYKIGLINALKACSLMSFCSIAGAFALYGAMSYFKLLRQRA